MPRRPGADDDPVRLIDGLGRIPHTRSTAGSHPCGQALRHTQDEPGSFILDPDDHPVFGLLYDHQTPVAVFIDVAPELIDDRHSPAERGRGVLSSEPGPVILLDTDDLIAIIRESLPVSLDDETVIHVRVLFVQLRHQIHEPLVPGGTVEHFIIQVLGRLQRLLAILFGLFAIGNGSDKLS